MFKSNKNMLLFYYIFLERRKNMKEISLTSNAWITPAQLESEYGITQGAQYKLRMRKNYESDASSKPIPYTKVGKRVLYYKDDIEKWLLSLRKGAINE